MTERIDSSTAVGMTPNQIRQGIGPIGTGQAEGDVKGKRVSGHQLIRLQENRIIGYRYF